MKELKRYRGLPYVEEEEIVSLVFKEAERMRKENGRINYHKLSRIIQQKTNIIIDPTTIRGWFVGKRKPHGKFKTARQPPDENARIVQGLLMTDLSRIDEPNTIWLSLNTTKDFFAYSIYKLLKNYGWAVIRPKLWNKRIGWEMSAYLERCYWVHELEEQSIHKFEEREKLKLLSGMISGDGWIGVSHMNRNRVQFTISFQNSDERKTSIFLQILDSLSIPHSFTRVYVKERQTNNADEIIKTNVDYVYQVVVSAEAAVKYLLMNLRLLQPFREVKRILALRFIEKDVCDSDVVRPVWDYLRALEKYSTIRSQIRACELIPDEKFAKKSLDRQRILKELHRKLYEYADRVRELRPEAKKIISGLRAIPSMGNIMRAAEEAGFTIPKEAGFIIARILERHQEAKITNGNSEKYARALIATNLVRLRLIRTQSKAARLLSISQGVVSRYLHRRREMSSLLKLPEVERLSREYFYSRSDEVIKKVRRILEAIAEVYNGYKATKYF